jgi:hypothetical protein
MSGHNLGSLSDQGSLTFPAQRPRRRYHLDSNYSCVRRGSRLYGTFRHPVDERCGIVEVKLGRMLHAFSPKNGIGQLFTDRAISGVRKHVRRREHIDHRHRFLL